MTDLHSVDWSTIPEPANDGGPAHLVGMQLPDVALPATDGRMVDVSVLEGTGVIYAYPMTGKPGVLLPEGWDVLPGARGCTPQSCAFRDHHSELCSLGANYLFGLSTQSTADQREAAERLHLPFPLLSDGNLALASALRLPTFEVAGMRLLRRLTMIVENGRIEHVFHPVFPPDRSAADVIEWLRANRRGE